MDISRLARSAALLLGLVCGGSAGAGERVTVLALAIDGLHHADGGGLYDRIIAALPVEPEIRVLPPARAFAEFERCRTCCISPANKNPEFYDFGDDYVVTGMMTEARVYIWTAPGAPRITSVEGLHGLRVGGRTGMPYGRTVEASGLRLELVSSIEANIRKLQAGRIDAFIAYTPDAITAFEALGIEPFPHGPEPVAVHPDSLICYANDDTRAFADRFDAGLAELRASGRLAELTAAQ